MINKISDHCYSVDKTIKLVGPPMGLRSTILKMANGKLVIISPVPFDGDEVREINELGPVDAVLAPNLFHHLYLRDAQKHFSSAKFYASPGLEKKRKNFNFDQVIDKNTQPWPEEIKLVLVEGVPKLNEVVAFHVESKSLIMCDLVFNLGKVDGIFLNLMLNIFGTNNRFAVSRLVKFLVKDKAQFARSLQSILDWPTERIIMAHGEIIHENALHRLRDIFMPIIKKYS